MIELSGNLVSRKQMETIRNSETKQSSTRQGDRIKQNFAKSKDKVRQIKSTEEESALTNFLSEYEISDSQETRIFLKELLNRRRMLESNFSLQDFTSSEIKELKIDSLNSEKQQIISKETSNAKSAESLVDQYKAEGLNNYQALQKLLVAHESGEVKLLAKKYTNFKRFFSFLTQEQFGANDTKRIIEAINQPGIDLTRPEAFETILFSIYEDDQISRQTKEKFRVKFKLFPIDTGDDLRENLKIKRTQVKVLERQRVAVSEVLSSLNEDVKDLDEELTTLKNTILIEQNSDKRLQLEKQYDALEERLEKLRLEKEQQEQLAHELQQQNITSTVFVRGASADLREGEILVTIPDSKTKISVASHMSSQAISKAVNSYLVYENLRRYGLESFFFYPSDFESGRFPDPQTIDDNDLFLFRFGFASDKLILRSSDLKDLHQLLSLLMRPESYKVNLTTKENATARLQELGLLEQKELNSELLISELLGIQQFGEFNEKNSRIF